MFNENDEPSEEEESEVESSDEPPKEGTYDQSEDQAAKSKTLEQAKRKQPDFGFHSTGFPKNPQMAPSFMTLGGGLGLIGSVKPPGTGFGRALYRQWINETWVKLKEPKTWNINLINIKDH